MDTQTKSFFSRLNNGDIYFNNIIKKLTLKENLTNDENSYILSLSIIFSDEYIKTEKSAYFEFAYYLVLNYSLNTKDFAPLLNFSFNNGFYPIAKSILVNEDESIIDLLTNTEISKYDKNGNIELKEQHDKILNLLSSTTSYRAFIAPTSYGKSSFIYDDIKKQNSNIIAIIVPKKALIWQTYKSIKALARELHYKILLHDTEYLGEKKFIGIFTQERATRLIQDNTISFDLLYIDEAHNLFEKDERNLLLARLIKLNKKLNPNQKLVYLSPLINEINNLKLNNEDAIFTQKISFNIKELDLNYLDKQFNYFKYNRFLDAFYKNELQFNGWQDFLIKKSTAKNLIYLNKPKDIEDFAKHLKMIFPIIDSKELLEIATIIEKYIDKNYLMRELILRGIIYIHSKVPDLIKDYLLTKFKLCKDIKYLISNSSVLEGVNFPIDSLFIFNVYALNGNNLKNLCGRVNRLNEIFSNRPQLEKLICPIYFVDTLEYGGKTSFQPKIQLLRNNEKDDVDNPLLINSKMEPDKKREILNRENSFINNYQNHDIKNILVKNNVHHFYRNFEKSVDKITTQICLIKKIDNIDNLIDIIFSVFLSVFEIDEICDYEFLRLKAERTREFYNNYINKIYYADIKAKIGYFLSYFNYYEANNLPFYIGESFGEIKYTSSIYSGTRYAYISTKNKSQNDKINLAVIKSKLEDDFISYKLAKLVKTLLDLDLISKSVYNKFLYNTDDEAIIYLINAGLSNQLITFIKENNLFDDFKFSETGFIVSDKFKTILENEDDFIKYEINKLL